MARRQERGLLPEQQARVEIDLQLAAAGWLVQDYRSMNLRAARGVAVRELPTAAGPADYVLFVDRQAIGVIEAKKVGTPLTGVEPQTRKYRQSPKDELPAVLVDGALPIGYESTGAETYFTSAFEPEPTARRVFTFHRPETFARWHEDHVNTGYGPLRAGLRLLPHLDATNLWPAQETAIKSLERSLRDNRPRALIQMATGSGKTFTAANICYRLVRHAGAARILFLVDRANLGRQTLKEFQGFDTPDDGRKFTELYNVQHLGSDSLDTVAKVHISTIQRMYSILRDEPLDPEFDEQTGYEVTPDRPVEVVYNPKVPMESYDVIIVDECHRSIYGVWRQVLEYFDAFLVGLTATPGKQTFGFFQQNLVMEYNHEQAVADRVNVDFDVFRIRTEITEAGGKVEAGLVTKFRDREKRSERYELIDDEIDYDPKELDRKVVAKDQIRTVLATLRDSYPTMFSDREPHPEHPHRLRHIPKTLIFAKDDSHADDIVQAAREEFSLGNEAVVKITYKSAHGGHRPEDLLQSFRNSYNPRIAVTVDMIATGTDVKPIECVVFMRMVRSRNFFEQMKGRGVRVASPDELRAVTPDATVKDHFVLVDAVGVTETNLNDTVPLERKHGVSFEKLLNQIGMGSEDDDVLSSVASRLARLDARITRADAKRITEAAGVGLHEMSHRLVDALDPDRHVAVAQAETGLEDPDGRAIAAARSKVIDAAVEPLMKPEVRELLADVKRSYEQIIDETTKDRVISGEFSKDATDRARTTVESFRQFIEEHKDEITALQVLYSRPYAQRLTFADIRDLADAISRPPRSWTAEQLWSAYDALDHAKVHGSPGTVLTNLVTLVRYAVGMDDELKPYPDLVAERFDAWMQQQSQTGRTFTDEQRRWLDLIRDHLAASLSIESADLMEAPFAQHGGLGKARELFDDLPALLDDLTANLAA
jgi:type I restriction enzyme R subunit